MPYQTGTVGPIIYQQDNSGVDTDTTTDIRYTPQEFGAPANAQIIIPSVHKAVHVYRGKASVHNEVNEANVILFQVYTQSADNGLFGHHSGGITVSTTFQWYTPE